MSVKPPAFLSVAPIVTNSTQREQYSVWNTPSKGMMGLHRWQQDFIRQNPAIKSWKSHPHCIPSPNRVPFAIENAVDEIYGQATQHFMDVAATSLPQTETMELNHWVDFESKMNWCIREVLLASGKRPTHLHMGSQSFHKIFRMDSVRETMQRFYAKGSPQTVFKYFRGLYDLQLVVCDRTGFDQEGNLCFVSDTGMVLTHTSDTPNDGLQNTMSTYLLGEEFTRTHTAETEVIAVGEFVVHVNYSNSGLFIPVADE